jgi:asparagine synthetase B (glutamine-hydrolysing)
MNKELFGVFGTRDEFDRCRSGGEFDKILSEDHITAGIRDPGLGVPGRSASHTDERGFCLVWGEAYMGKEEQRGESDRQTNVAEWLFERYESEGCDAFSELNGSYLVVIATDGEARVVTDPIRSWECFYADIGGNRMFSTDPSVLKESLAAIQPHRESLLEYIHLGTVLGTRTLIEGLHRVPFDGYLTGDTTESLSRFVYDPRPFDYVTELTRRLLRAVDRRADLPGPKGLLLSGGNDSRIFLSHLSDIDQSYTIGNPDSREVKVARKVASQYDSAHTVLIPDDRYLMPSDEKIRYSQGIKESLHIHHAGFDDAFEVQTMYHGSLLDTLLKGYFLERDGVEMLGMKLPSKSLASDPNPIESLLDTLGFFPEESEKVAEAASEVFGVDLTVDSPYEFLHGQFEEELETCWERTDSIHNAMDLLVIKNQPILPSHTHLADNYYEAFVAADRELIEWHLMTPPEYRRYETFRKAIERIDPAILKHRPQSQPLSSVRLNQIERFLRRKLPFLEPFEAAWPNRDEIYDQHEMDQRLFPDQYPIHQLPARLKLRVNDARWWLS